MILTAINIPVWKTKDYILEIDKVHGTYHIYLHRMGFFYMKNEHGIKVKFAPKDEADKLFYEKVYQEKRGMGLGVVTVVGI